MGLIRAFCDFNIKLSRDIDALLPSTLTTHGSEAYSSQILPALLHPNQIIYELGGGSRPYLNKQRKSELAATVVGLDISENELTSAPAGIYDRRIVADLTKFTGQADADLVICQTTLEHVLDTNGAMLGLASTLTPGGRAALLIPCRNAIFARLNLLLPEGFKLRALRFFHADKGRDGHDGFPAYYHRCTPSEIAECAGNAGLEVETSQSYWTSNYFRPLLPIYLIWRVWTIIARACLGPDFCENFVIVLKKPPGNSLS